MPINEQTFKSLWKVDDADWVQEREESWSGIEQCLRNMPYDFEKKSFPIIKHYYMAGEEHELLSTKNPRLQVEVCELLGSHLSTTLVGQLWLCPSDDIDTLRSYVEFKSSRIMTIKTAQNDLKSHYRWGARSEYELGVFGGKERVIIDALYPSLDYKVMWPKETKRTRLSKGIHPSTALYFWARHCRQILFQATNRHLMGQYLSKYANYGLKHYLLDFQQSPVYEEYLADLDDMLVNAANFYERETARTNVDWVVKFREKLFKELESGEYCDFIQDRWELAKKSIGK